MVLLFGIIAFAFIMNSGMVGATSPEDKDGDGIPDKDDECINEKGPNVALEMH